jgi:hypothetical protein
LFTWGLGWTSFYLLVLFIILNHGFQPFYNDYYPLMKSLLINLWQTKWNVSEMGQTPYKHQYRWNLEF